MIDVEIKSLPEFQNLYRMALNNIKDIFHKSGYLAD